MDQEAVASESGDMACDGGVGGTEDASDLAQGGAFADEPSDGQKQIGPAEPVSCGEGGGAEAASAVGAAEVLESTLIGASGMAAIAHESPIRSALVEGAVGVGAAGWLEASGAPGG